MIKKLLTLLAEMFLGLHKDNPVRVEKIKQQTEVKELRIKHRNDRKVSRENRRKERRSARALKH